MRLHVQPGGHLQGVLRVPGDKSISHRALLLGAIAEGTTYINGFLDGTDCLATLAAVRNLGVEIEGPHAGQVVVHGQGLRGLRAPRQALDLGNSGTSMRLLAGLLCAQPFASTLSGDASLARRPMRRIQEPLSRMGAHIEMTTAGTPPLRVGPSSGLQAIDYRLPIASAQVKSAILLAALYADGQTRIIGPSPTRDHTERMLMGFGYPIDQAQGHVGLPGGRQLQAARIDIPADTSSAAFFLVAASIARDSDVMLTAVGVNPTRTGIIEVLRRMGGDIELLNERTTGGEPVADLRIRAAPLQGIAIPEALVPLAIDELPVALIAAACAAGETVLTGAGELRHKECDRIAVMAEGLARCGIEVTTTEDGLRLQGGRIQGATIDSHGDHRIAMAFAVAGLVATGTMVIGNCANVDTSFPGFAALARAAGLKLDTA